MPSMSAQVTPASAQASSRVGTIQRRCARAATSGTIPPVAAWSATWLATTLAWIRVPASTNAIPVSSHDDSMARTSGARLRRLGGGEGRVGPEVRRRSGVEGRPEPREPLAHRAGGQRLGGHDQRIFLVVAVVARPDPDRPEAILLVQPPGAEVG